MMKGYAAVSIALSLLATTEFADSQAPSNAPVPVTIDNYNRAQSDAYFALVAKGGGFDRFLHARELAPIDQHGIIRPNRDTLYSMAVFDLDAGPVTVTLPNPGKHFLMMQVINEDQYTQSVYYGAGSHTFTRAMVGTRYAVVVVRMLIDQSRMQDIQKLHALQDELKVSHQSPGAFVIPKWDDVSRRRVQAALLQLGTTLADTRHMYGANEKQVDPVRHLIASAMLWGGTPEKDCLYLPITPLQNDGSTVYRLNVKGVPVDGFWSVSVYNSEGYFQPNSYAAYSVNSTSAKTSSDGSITIQFGACDGKIVNCLPITKGWNYTVRLVQPRPQVLDGTWTFPLAQPVG